MSTSPKSPSLDYHSLPTPGKIALHVTKPCDTQEELSLAYSPGVAEPCLAIRQDPEQVWLYTSRANSVAVVSDGTAVLGLGDLGAAASLPVMEGKAVLFKRFADIDAYPICLDGLRTEAGRTDAGRLIAVTAALAPTFGGINLEDIAAPACFRIEEELKQCLDIPVFHDDQHGTAIISLAGVRNALELVGKRLETARIVVNGAGAAGIACLDFYLAAGAQAENCTLCDSRGVIYVGREHGMTPQKTRLAADTSARSLADAMVGADVVLGLSVAGVVSAEMVRSMAPDPIIFAMANPLPEIYPDAAAAAGAAVVGTGRSDFPNQVNNVLGFPGIFRGALDVRARDINEAMKVAAAQALSELAHAEIPAPVKAFLTRAYPADAARGVFDGRDPLKPTYVIPKPFDPRVVPRVARRVAEAAMRTGVSRQSIPDTDGYEQELLQRLSPATDAG